MSATRYAGFPAVCGAAGLPVPVAEHRLHPVRRWQLDFAWPAARVALEVHGGVFAQVRGAHSRGAGQRDDFEKWSVAAALGWRVLHVLPQSLAPGGLPRVLALVRQTLRWSDPTMACAAPVIPVPSALDPDRPAACPSCAGTALELYGPAHQSPASTIWRCPECGQLSDGRGRRVGMAR